MKTVGVRLVGGAVPSVVTESPLVYLTLGAVLGLAAAFALPALVLVLVPLVTLLLLQHFGATGRVTARVEAGRVRLPMGAEIRASEVLAITTARLDDPARPGAVSIAIAHRRRPDAPLLLDVDSDEDAEAVVVALGGGTHGAGHHVTFANPMRGVLGAFIAGSAAIATATFRATLPEGMAWFPFASAVGAIVASFAFWQRASGLSLHRSEFRYAGVLFPYAQIASVDVNGREVRTVLTDGRVLVVNDIGEPRHLAAHLRTAAVRAHGPAAIEPEPHALLVPPRGDRLAWLARIDTEARATGGHYRSAGLDAQSAWATLRDPDQPALARAAAARVLVLLGEAREAIAEALATLHGPGATEQARVVARLDEAEPEAVAAAIDDLDAIDQALADEDPTVARGRRSS